MLEGKELTTRLFFKKSADTCSGQKIFVHQWAILHSMIEARASLSCLVLSRRKERLKYGLLFPHLSQNREKRNRKGICNREVVCT